jgi:Protein of unknown function (DUF935)
MAKSTTLRAEDGFDLPKLGVEEGSVFGWFDRQHQSLSYDGNFLVDYADWAARDMFEMLGKDYKARQIENVLSLPVMSAEYQIAAVKGGEREAEFLNNYFGADRFSGGPRTSLDQIIGLCTSAFFYRRAYFEKVWRKGTGDFEGKIVYDDIAFRPQTTCRLRREPLTGRYAGFEQEAYYLGPEIRQNNLWPTYIPPSRAFVFTHGTRRDPINGASDMDVAYWAWKTKQKVLLLWFQFLQGVALPRTIVKANDIQTSRNIAREIARMKGSGVLPVAVPGGPDSVGIDLLDASGKGSDQFREAIQWLDNAATQSVLAGFLDLTSSANEGHGSYALSNDASDFFLQSLEAKTREIEDQVRSGLFAPLIYHNFGPTAKVPTLQFEPLNDIDKATAVALLQTAIAAPPGGPIPSSFIAGLAEQVSHYLGLDANTVGEDFRKSFDAAAAQAKAQALASTAPGATSPVGQSVAGLAGAVSAAQEAVLKGGSKKDAAAIRKAHATDEKLARQHVAHQSAAQDMVARATEDSLRAKTGDRKTLGLPKGKTPQK